MLGQWEKVELKMSTMDYLMPDYLAVISSFPCLKGRNAGFLVLQQLGRPNFLWLRNELDCSLVRKGYGGAS